MDRDREGAALAQGALDLDGTVHEVHDVLDDGHAQARALGVGDAGVVRTGERLKDVLEELLVHAAARVGKNELVAGAAGPP